MSRHQTSSELGFSLIELMAVITVLSILAITVYPSFTARDDAILSVSAEILSSDIRLTRLNAVATGSSRSITLTAGSGAYVHDSDGGSGKTRDLSELGRGIAISTDAHVGFNSLGENGPAETVIRITLNGDSRTVTVSPFTGKTSVQ